MVPNSKRDREVIDGINAQQQEFKDKVRELGMDRQMQPGTATDLRHLPDHDERHCHDCVGATGASQI